MGNRSWLRGCIVVSLLACGCGGTTRHGRAEPQQTVESLRFSKLAAGLDRYCGLTLEDGALVCVADGKVSLERLGPFADFALHEDLPSYRELCTIDVAGQLACDLSRDVPTGAFNRVAVGFFNPCALDRDGRPVCWMPPELGGSPAPDNVGAGAVELSADMNHACLRFDQIGHVQCFGGQASESVSELHFARISATPSGACGISSDPMLGTGVVCVENAGITKQLEGSFTSLDTSVNGDGCAIDTDGAIRCWGGRQEPAPAEALSQVSVSAAMICALTADGAARCFDG